MAAGEAVAGAEADLVGAVGAVVQAAEDSADSEAAAVAEAGPLEVGKQRGDVWRSCYWWSKGVARACSRRIRN